MCRSLLFLFMLGLASVVSAQSFSSLEERMSAAEFKAAGLDKLSAEELQALNAWIRGRSQLPAAGTPAPIAAEDRRGLPDQESDDEAIRSRISGQFNGWQGTKTTVKLDNGQVWKSVDSSARLAVKLSNPNVVITPGLFDSWYMQVEGYNTSVRVKRLR